jgi:hypothetical protein
VPGSKRNFRLGRLFQIGLMACCRPTRFGRCLQRSLCEPPDQIMPITFKMMRPTIGTPAAQRTIKRMVRSCVLLLSPTHGRRLSSKESRSRLGQSASGGRVNPVGKRLERLEPMVIEEVVLDDASFPTDLSSISAPPPVIVSGLLVPPDAGRDLLLRRQPDNRRGLSTARAAAPVRRSPRPRPGSRPCSPASPRPALCGAVRRPRQSIRCSRSGHDQVWCHHHYGRPYGRIDTIPRAP